jgi:hypothetical protein
VCFSHITGESFYTHATVVESKRVVQYPARFLSDHSACVDTVMTNGVLRFRCQDVELLRKLEAHRGQWTRVSFEAGTSANCKIILDWPHVYIRTVDGDMRDDPDVSFYCNVFWRLPSFALWYVTRTVSVSDKLPRPRAPGTA